MDVKWKQLNINDIKPYEENPRTITKISRDKLKKSIIEIPDFLKARPLIVEEKTNELIAGHQRLDICLELGYTFLDCVVINDITEEEKKRLRVIDNIQNGQFDRIKIKAQYKLEDLIKWDYKPEQQQKDPVVDTSEPEMAAIFSYIQLYTAKDITIPLTEEEAEQFADLVKEYEEKNKTLDNFIKWLLNERK